MSVAARAWAAWGAIGVIHVTALWLFVTQPSQPGAMDAGDVVMIVVGPILYASLGLLMLVKGRGGMMGLLFMVIPACVSGGLLAQEWAVRAMLTRPLPGDDIAAALNTPFSMVLSIALGMLLMLFPDGRFMNGFWRVVAIVSVASAAATTVISILSDAFAEPIFRSGFVFDTSGLGLIRDPDGSITSAVSEPGIVAGMSGIIALLLRFRKARGDVRLQLRWLAWTVGTGLGLLMVSGLPVFPSGTNTLAGALLILGIPTGAAIAVLKYRLYEIDVVISKTLVYGALAAVVTGVYVAIVSVVGLVAGRRDEPSLAASILATAAVALLFQPARDRLQRLANRLVFGERDTPYQVLARVSRDLAEAGAGEQVLHRIAETLARGTGAERTTVWLRDAHGLSPAAAWPPEAANAPVPSAEQVVADLVLPVQHDGEVLGALSIAKPADERLTGTERRLAEHLASQAGLVLRNARLTADLRAQLAELRASRQRLVKAQNEARRRIERNLHDGAQQEIVAIKIKLGIAAQVADPSYREQIAALQNDVGDALEALRALARGIYPPLLASDGLEAALRSFASRLPVPVEVEVNAGRYDQETESTLYFCVLECLRHAREGTAVSVEQVGGALTFIVSGLSSSVAEADTIDVADRLAALDGTFTVEVSADSATARGSMPAVEMATT